MKVNLKQKSSSVFNDIKNKFFYGIATRWIVNIFSPVLAVVLLSCIILSVFVTNFYNMSAKNTIITNAQSTANYFENFVSTQYNQNSEFASHAQQLVRDFDNKNMMEIQVSNISGKIAYSSTGFTVNELNITPDVLEARNGKEATWTGIFETTKEKVISVSVPLYDNSGNLRGTVRMISSLERIESTLNIIYVVIFLIGFSIIALTAISGIFFIKSIVIPVRQINDVAIEIAEGNLTTNALQYSSGDELGRLCQSIHTMADKLSETEKVKNDFISQISHELRTPITAIRGWSETLMANEALDDMTLRGATVINKETERLSKMVEEMLDMSRIQSGRLNVNLAPVNIIAEFEDTVFMMSERSKGENVTIRYEISEDECTIEGDKDRLKQVFFNVIDNAVKHSNPGSEVLTTVNVGSKYVEFAVEDFGAGISKDDLPYIKEMFYKGSSQKRGSGIGLGVSDEIIRLHSGTLEIESELGIGTKVTITLPIKEENHIDS
ncbi:MAG: HAMP domain-containing protein [Clostridia bacterium]|nr:HAMP domain-containing protein [Clostridia bacterium]